MPGTCTLRVETTKRQINTSVYSCMDMACITGFIETACHSLLICHSCIQPSSTVLRHAYCLQELCSLVCVFGENLLVSSCREQGGSELPTEVTKSRFGVSC